MQNGEFPRDLKPLEKDLLFWLLPEERPGYAEYRRLLQQWRVVAQGRRGSGNYIVASIDERPDNESPLPSVVAYGVVETSKGEVSVALRERLGNQVEFEIAVLGKGESVELAGERRRWTYSRWLPGSPCPQCELSLREVSMRTKSGRTLVLAICAKDRRLWIYDGETGMNRPVPVTNFYNELMLHTNVRDPKIALDSQRLFQDLDSFRDSDLFSAFRTYNQIRMKVALDSPIAPLPERRPSLLRRVIGLFGNKQE